MAGDADKGPRKRKSMWDTDQTGKEAKSDSLPLPLASTAAGITPLLSSIPVASAAGSDSSSMLAQAQMQQAMQQQHLLQQVRALAQQRVSEVAAKQSLMPVSGSVANRIYVGNLFYELTETEILLAFSVFGAIMKIDMPKDPATGRHKGFCFIEFTNADSAATAVTTMQDFVLAGRPIKVGRPNNFAATVNPSSSIVFPTAAQQSHLFTGSSAAPSANIIQAKMQAQAVAAAISQQKLMSAADSQLHTPVSVTANNTKIYVGSIYYEIKEDDIKAIFSAFGPIKSCQLLPNPETGKHKGYGFVEYENEASASAAIASMNGFELAGRPIKVGWASASLVSSQSVSPGALPIPVPIPPLPVKKEPAAPKLEPTRCIVLLNMVGSDEVDDDLHSEVTEECGKFGVVEKVVIYQEDESKQRVDAPVRIFVLFQNKPESEKALKSLHGRWFGGRQVLARFFDVTKFEASDFSL